MPNGDTYEGHYEFGKRNGQVRTGDLGNWFSLLNIVLMPVDSGLIGTVSSVCFRGSTNLRTVPGTSENMLKIKSTVKAPLSIQMDPDTKVIYITMKMITKVYKGVHQIYHAIITKCDPSSVVIEARSLSSN